MAIRMSRLCAAGIEAVAESEINQHREGQRGREGDGVERSYSHSRFAGNIVPNLEIGGHQQAQAAMHIHTAGGDLCAACAGVRVFRKRRELEWLFRLDSKKRIDCGTLPGEDASQHSRPTVS